MASTSTTTSGIWNVISPSQFAWEQEALDYVRARLGSWALGAWANFEFMTLDGAIYEVDLLVLTRDRLYLVEIKSFPGHLKGDAATWYLQDGNRSRVLDNPLYLTNKKAKVLKGLLAAQAPYRKTGLRLPYVEPLVFLSNPSLKCDLETHALQHITVREERAQPPRISIIRALEGQGGPPALDRGDVRRIHEALDEAGIRRLQKSRTVGDYRLGEILGEGPGYQDRLAEHQTLAGITKRIRHYLITKAASQEERDQVRRAAEREYRLVEPFRHPGILRAQDFRMHEHGPALVFEHEPDSLRLQQFLDAHLDSLGIEERLDLWRQVVEALRYAHSRKVLHRGLSPLSIEVHAPDGQHPQLKVGDWQTGAVEGGTTGTIHVHQLVETQATAYVAPEALSSPHQAGEYSDIFSLGALGYTILSGCAPASSHMGLRQLLEKYGGLRLSSVQDGVPQELDDLIFRCTRPEVGQRPASTEALLEEIDDILERLRAAEDVEDKPPANPLDARPGDRLTDDLVVLRRLGQGSVSVAFLVLYQDEERVLKLARDLADDARLAAEAEVLSRLDHRHLVRLVGTVPIAGRVGLVLESSGRETLAARLLEQGHLNLDLLQRFGDDLLSALEYLEGRGIAHRDLKPGNLGVTRMGKDDTLHVVLFDFSLSRVPAETLGAGTPQYMDPFLSLRRPPRWDLQAERYSAAVTLYEMATGVLPRWGDGVSDPALVQADLVLEPDRFEPSLRDTMTAFFRRALNRDWNQRFDNAEEMRRAWAEVFAPAQATTGGPEGEPPPPGALPESLTLDSPVAALPMSAGALQILDRLGVVRVVDFLQRPARDIMYVRGAGNQTRREVRDVLSALLQRFPDQDVTEPDAPEKDAPFSVDRLVRALLEAGKIPKKDPLKRLATVWLGLDREPGGDLAVLTLHQAAAQVQRPAHEVARAVRELGQGWKALPAMGPLGADLQGLLRANGGAMPLTELAEALLAARGSVSDQRHQRLSLAWAATRAALEVEGLEASPRFAVHQIQGNPFVVLGREAATWAEELGRVADELVQEEPLPPPYRVLQLLRDVQVPAELAQGIQASDPRLLRLAASASGQAAVSAREELYPRQMAARRALILAHGALLGENRLSVEEVHRRVAGRYPEAEPLPPRPDLDALLKEAGWDFHWVEEDAAYIRLGAAPLSTASSTYSRHRTTEDGRRETEDDLETARFQDRLGRALQEGSFLVLSVRPRWYRQARRELERRFGLEVRSLDRLLVEAMRQKAEELEVDWRMVTAADTAPNTADWSNLLRLVREARPVVEQQLLEAKRPLLLVEAGLLARYDQMELLEALRDASGARDGQPAMWLLLPADEQKDLPALDGHPIPVLTPGQRARIPRPWLRPPTR